MTSNYYKSKDLSVKTSLSSIVTGIQKTTPISYINTGLPEAEKAFIADINEKPTSLGYIYNSTTDISEYCIASYVQSSGTAYSSIPTWCTKIRAVLVGGGGTGGTGEKGTANFTPAVNSNYETEYYHNYYNVWFDDNNYTNTTINLQNNSNSTRSSYSINLGINQMQYQYSYVRTNTSANYTVLTTGKGGGGGGGGAFLYLDNIPVQSTVGLTVVKGGPATATTLQIGTTTYTANKGGNANTVTKGTGGAASATGTLMTKGDDGGDPTNATAGQGGNSGLYYYSSTLKFGKGSSGTDGGAGNIQPGPAGNGEQGYYRIYYLVN